MLKNRIIKYICLITLASILLAPVAMAESDGIAGATDKISLQKALEERTTSMLTDILGHDKFIVSIDLDLNRSRYETFKEEWKSSGNRLASGGTSAGYNYTLPAIQDEALPGIPMKQSYEAKNVGSPMGGLEGMIKLTSRSINMPSDIFRRMKVTVLYDESVSEEDVATIRRLAPVILGINRGRGDSFGIAKVNLKNPSLLGLLAKNNESLLINALKYGALFGFLAGVILLFFNRAKSLLQEIVPFLGKSDEGAAPLQGVPGTGGEEKIREKNTIEIRENAKDEEEGLMKDFFTFIRDKDTNKLKYYLRNKDPRTIAAILLYMEPALSAKVLMKMPRELKDAVALSMAKPMQLSPDVLERLEEDLKAGVAGTAGGIEEFMNIFNNLPGHETHKILSTLEQHDPSFATMVKKLKFTFEDVVALKDKDLQTVLTQSNPKDIAMALRTIKPAEADKIKRNLTEEALEMVNEWNEITTTVNKNKLEQSIHTILEKAKELAEQGVIETHYGTDEIEEYEIEVGTGPNKVTLKAPQISEAPAKKQALPQQPKAKPQPEPKAEPVAQSKAAAPKPQSGGSLDKLAEMDAGSFENLLKEINPKTLSIALQNNGNKLREKIAKVSPEYLKKLKMYDTIIGKQPAEKVAEAKQQIFDKMAKVAH